MEGNMFYVLATLGSVCGTIILKNVMEKVSPYVVTVVGFFFAALTFAPFMLWELNKWNFSQLNYAGSTGILFGVFFSSALAYFLYYEGLSRVKAQEVGIFTYIDPICAIIVAIPLLHEYPTFSFIAGSLLVFGGIIISEAHRNNHHRIHKY